MTAPHTAPRSNLRASLLLLWGVLSFVGVFFARDMTVVVAGWPLNYWFCAQGVVLCYIVIVAVYARLRRHDGAPVAGSLQEVAAERAQRGRMHRNFWLYVA